MTTQVVPLISFSSATDYTYWAELGIKGALITIVLLVIGISIWKGKIGFVSIGPSEAGIREFCGLKLWMIGPGLHPDIEGIWKARKASTARDTIRIESSALSRLTGLTMIYMVMVSVEVIRTRAALIAQIYVAKDTNRDNMENSEARLQATGILASKVRTLVEIGMRAENIEAQLAGMSYQELLIEYGYVVRKTRVDMLVVRPMSEMARAVESDGGGAIVIPLPENDFGHAGSEAVAG